MMFEVQNGCFRYDAANMILNDINFSLQGPEIISILGANGAGKTTLIKCMLGLLRWSGGGSYLDGKDIKTIRGKEFWKKIGYVPQAKLSSFVYTVGEMAVLGRSSHLGEFAQPGPEDWRIVDECLDLIGIRHLKDKLCSKISGGEYQLALIARALAAQPSLLVLDEPESNLDFKNQMVVLNTISALCSEHGISAVINTHYPNHALDISNRTLLLMRDGTSVFGRSDFVLAENNLKRAFEVSVHIHTIGIYGNDYTCVIPLRDDNATKNIRSEQIGYENSPDRHNS